MSDISIDNILDIVKQDNRIMAVYMNGSRCNVNVDVDQYQDYDLVFVVENTEYYIYNLKLVESFGSIAYYQSPEYYDYRTERDSNIKECYGWLVQYKEGHRIDLHVVSLSYALRTIKDDSLTIILYDRDGQLPKLPLTSEDSYLLKKPSEIEFDQCCNEFWWCLNNVAKGIARNDYLSTLSMLDGILRVELLKLLGYKVGYNYEYKINLGKASKFLVNYIDKGTYLRYLETYSNADFNNIKKAVMTMINLFDEVAIELAKQLAYKYNADEAYNSRKYLLDIIENDGVKKMSVC